MTIERIGPTDPVQSFKKTKPTEKPKPNQGADSINLSEEAKSKAEVYQAAEMAKNAPEIRWELVEAAKIVLAKTLHLMGMTAPERM